MEYASRICQPNIKRNMVVTGLGAPLSIVVSDEAQYKSKE